MNGSQEGVGRNDASETTTRITNNIVECYLTFCPPLHWRTNTHTLHYTYTLHKQRTTTLSTAEIKTRLIAAAYIVWSWLWHPKGFASRGGCGS